MAKTIRCTTMNVTKVLIRPGCLLSFGFACGLALGATKSDPPTSVQGPDPLFYDRTSFTVRDGLPSNMVRSLAVDQDGSLWIGTSGGLARYDGYEFKPFPAATTPGVSSDRMLSMHVDAGGTLWAGVEDALAFVRRDGVFAPAGDNPALLNVKQFLEAEDGTLWLAGRRLSAFRGRECTVYPLSATLQSPGSREATVTHRIAIDRDGILWVASDVGLLKLENERLTVVDMQRCTWVLTDFNGIVWARFSDDTVVPMDSIAGTSLRMPSEYIHSELDLGDRRRLLATSDGLVLMTSGPGDPGSLSFQNVDSGRRVAALVDAYAEGIWSGTIYDGLEHLRPQFVRPVPLSKDEPDLAVSNIFSDGGDGAIACDIRGHATVWISPDGSVRTLETPPNEAEDIDLVTGAVLFQEQRLVSRSSGLHVLVEDQLRRVPGFGQEVRTIGGSETHGAWLHRADGLLIELLDAGGATGRAVDIGPLTGRLALHADGLLFAAEGQVRRFDPATLEVAVVAELPGVVIRHIAEGESGDIWISTYGHGLFRKRAEGTMDHWSLEEGLPNAYLGWICPPETTGKLLINSNSGIISLAADRLDRQSRGESSDIEARLFTAPEGNGDMGALLGDGCLALPTVRGLVLFDPSATPPPPPPPRVSIQSIKADGMPWFPGAKLKGSVVLEFEHRAMAFPSATSAIYEHRLIGHDDSWVSGDRSQHVRYSNVTPGDYAFEVRARTNDRPWSAPTRSPSIVVVPYWHDRTPVRWLGAILGLLAVRGLIWLRTRAAIHQTQALQAEVKRRITTEARLRTSEERFRRLFDTAPSAIVAWDPGGQVLDWNDRAGPLFGWADGVMDSSNFAEHLEDPAPACAAFEKVKQGVKELTIESSVKQRIGPARHCRWHFAPILDGQGKIQMVITLISDLTDSERAAKDIGRLRERVAKAEETERGRIARELHDDLSQRLAALAIDAHMAGQAAESNEQVEAEMLRHFQVQVESIAEDVHALSRKLHPTIVDDLGLLRALRSECVRRAQHAKIKVKLEAEPGFDEPNKEIALALFRIAQEAMQNAWKHGEATEIRVRLTHVGENHVIEINDNGSGFRVPEGHSAHGGIGIASMRERARLVGGELEIESTLGAGTRVVASVPTDSVPKAW